MLISYRRGQTSVILRVKILNSSLSTGAGITGLTSSSTGLVISTIADTEATATAYTVAGSTIESITTLGTYAAPTAGKVRFKEVDATNHKGIYEIQISNARFSVSNAKFLIVSISGATAAAETDVVIPLQDLDPYTAADAAVWNATRSTYATAGTFGQGAASVQGNVTGNVAGTVASVTGGVGSITGVTFPTNFGVMAIAATTGQVGIDLSSIKQAGVSTTLNNIVVPTVSTVTTANLNLSQAVPTSNTAQTVGDALNAARAQGFGKWVLSGTSLTLYAADGSTAIRTFTLDSATAPTQRS
jgi:hypothetical protein